MKKSITLFSSLLCAAVMGINAGAFNYSNTWTEWDIEKDLIYYHDLETDEILAVEYPDGTLVEYDEIVPEIVDEDEIISDDYYIYDEDIYEEASDEADYNYDYSYDDWDDDWWEDLIYSPAATEIINIKTKSEEISFTASIDSYYEFERWELSRQDWWITELVAEGKDFYTINSSTNGIDFNLTGLIPGEEYNYTLKLYSSYGAVMDSTDFSITTEMPEFKTAMLDPSATDTSISLQAVIDSRKEADGFVVEKYSGSKWVRIYDKGQLWSYSFPYDSAERDYYQNYDLKCASYTIYDLKPMTKYKYRIRFYKTNEGKRKYIKTVKCTASTLMETPALELGATTKKASLSWDKVKGADGYEVYVYESDASEEVYDDYFWYYGWNDMSSMSYGGGWFNEADYTKLKTIKSGDTTSVSFKIQSGKKYTYCIRAYQKSGKTKIYSGYSNTAASDSKMAKLNGLTLNPQTTLLNDYDKKLVQAALKECVNDNMTNAEKAYAVYNYVHNAAIYEYDYYKISTDSIEAILANHAGQCYQFAATYQAMMKYLGFDMKLIGGKTASGGPHWWNELTINGTPYMFDPQVGGRFCIRYEELGSRMVTKEKTVD